MLPINLRKVRVDTDAPYKGERTKFISSITLISANLYEYNFEADKRNASNKSLSLSCKYSRIVVVSAI